MKYINLILILFIIITSCNLDKRDLGDGYNLFINGSRVYLTHKNKIIINNRVIKTNFNEEFILVYRIIVEGDLNKIGVYQFFIIDKNHSAIHGPLTFDEYLTKRESLKVKNDLRLNIDI